MSSAPAPTPSADTVLFNMSKKELYVPSSGYKTLQNRLKVNWNVGLQRDDITLERLNAAKLVVFGAPRDKFSASEVQARVCMSVACRVDLTVATCVVTIDRCPHQQFHFPYNIPSFCDSALASVLV